jgi:hypothetical protein
MLLPFGNLSPDARMLTFHTLVEVERAAALLRSIGLDKQIKRVETADDSIVYAGDS